MACVIAAPKSGSGKTLLSLTLASWARLRGLNLQPFKVGPDYLDQQLLTAIASRPCRNLDLILSGPEWVNKSFHGFAGSADLALIEGVMGLFDGIGSTQKGSTADIARHLGLPVVLVIDACGQAGSIAALAGGFRNHDPKINIAGVVLNRIKTKRHQDLLTEALSDIGIKVLGCLPEDPQLKLPSRHLGLVPAHEIANLNLRLEAWAEIAESNLNLEILKKLLSAPKSIQDPIKSLLNNQTKGSSKKLLPVAIAQDEAFHFHYSETKDYLEALGMPIIPWKPLHDEPLPQKAKGIILPGGFPEQFAEQISNCSRSIRDLRESYGKRPIYAECGGMLLLGQTLTDLEGVKHEMAGLLPFNAQKGNLQVGYRRIKGTKNSLLVRKGDQLTGHEFHYWDFSIPKNSKNDSLIHSNTGITSSPWKIKGWRTNSREEGWSNNLFHASWIHLHWASCVQIIHRWRTALDK